MRFFSPNRIPMSSSKIDQRVHRRLIWEELEDRTLLAAEFFVTFTGDTVDANPGDGIAQDASGNTSLRAAIMEASALAGQDDHDRSRIIPLTRGGAESESNRDLDITDDVIIRSDGTGNVTIDAAGLDRVFHVHPGAAAQFWGLNITGGSTAGDGGGIYNEGGVEGSTVEIFNSAVYGNSAGDGGGLYNAGLALLTDTTVSGNTAGGGIFNDAAGVLSVTTSTIVNNTGTAGAGINNEGTAGITGSIVGQYRYDGRVGNLRVGRLQLDRQHRRWDRDQWICRDRYAGGHGESHRSRLDCPAKQWRAYTFSPTFAWKPRHRSGGSRAVGRFRQQRVCRPRRERRIDGRTIGQCPQFSRHAFNRFRR